MRQASCGYWWSWVGCWDNQQNFNFTSYHRQSIIISNYRIGAPTSHIWFKTPKLQRPKTFIHPVCQFLTGPLNQPMNQLQLVTNEIGMTVEWLSSIGLDQGQTIKIRFSFLDQNKWTIKSEIRIVLAATYTYTFMTLRQKDRSRFHWSVMLALWALSKMFFNQSTFTELTVILLNRTKFWERKPWRKSH